MADDFAVPPGSAPPRASVIMPTRNRREELRRAIASCLTQSVPVEVIVRDDASDDGTEEMIRDEFPWVDYERSPSPRGSIANRNLAAKAARTNVVVSLDDDAAFSSPHTVEQTLRELAHPRVGAVAIPFIDVNHGPGVLQRAPSVDGLYVAAYFRGCASAWRRDLFMAIGGYSEVLFHMAEEPEFCMRLLSAGYVTRLGTADPVLHYESLARDPKRIVALIVRNGVLFGILDAPTVMMPIHALGSAVRSVASSVPRGHVRQTVRGLAQAVRAAPSAWRNRHPVRRIAYFLFRSLVRSGPRPLEDVIDHLPPVSVSAGPVEDGHSEVPASR